MTIGDTISAIDKQEALPRITVEEPTIKVTFIVNTSPFAGKSGKWVTSRHVRERLYKEAMKNLALRVEETAEPDTFLVFGRGELMLAILVETMRREGYEFSLGMPEVVVKEIDGVKSEPVELVIIDVPDQYVGAVTTRLGERRGQMMKMANLGFGRARIEFKVPSRGLIGFRSRVPHRDARHRPAQHAVRRLAAVRRPDAAPLERRDRLRSPGHGHPLRPVPPPAARHAADRRPARPCTRA